MALKEALQSIRNEFEEEIREVKSLLSRLRSPSENSSLGTNFRKFGASFGAFEFDSFLELARNFYAEGMASNDPMYSVIPMQGNRLAIDYNGEIRGIFTRRGKPLAFFRPDYRQLGFPNKAEELQAFRRSVMQ